MLKKSLLLKGLVLGSMLSLSACNFYDIQKWDGQSDHQIKVACGNGCKVLAFEPGTSHLSNQSKQKIKHFAKQNGHAKPIYIATCDHNSPSTALDNERLSTVSWAIEKMGYKVATVRPVISARPLRGGCVVIVTGKLKVVPPKCQGWTKPGSRGHINQNFGCATKYNLAKMIADPADLLAAGGDHTGTYSTRVEKGIERYHAGIKSKLDKESVSKG